MSGSTRVVVEVLGRAALADDPVPDHRHLVGHRQRLVLVVGDEHGGDAAVAEDLRTSDRTEARREASSEENGSSSRTSDGLDGQGPGQGHPLLLAAGELVRVAVGHPGQADHLEQGVGGRVRAAPQEPRPPKATLAATVRWGKRAPSWGT